jgi:hypothetical protein
VQTKPRIPRLVGVIHLGALPDSPRFQGDLEAVVASAARDAEVLIGAGYDAVVVENFGDAPFVPDAVSAVTVASMTACARAVRAAAPKLELGINVLRNDAEAALAIAVASGATFVRINVHVGARVTDQGVVQGHAHVTVRRRRELGAERVRLFCDVDVKHAAPLAPRPIAEEALELAERGLADAVLVTGAGTGQPARASDLEAVARAVGVPVLVASGATIETLAALRGAGAHGVIVGSCLRVDDRAGIPIDPARAAAFADRFRAVFGA